MSDFPQSPGCPRCADDDSLYDHTCGQPVLSVRTATAPDEAAVEAALVRLVAPMDFCPRDDDHTADRDAALVRSHITALRTQNAALRLEMAVLRTETAERAEEKARTIALYHDRINEDSELLRGLRAEVEMLRAALLQDPYAMDVATKRDLIAGLVAARCGRLGREDGFTHGLRWALGKLLETDGGFVEAHIAAGHIEAEIARQAANAPHPVGT